MENKVSRRQFLKTGCIAAAAVGVTACGGTALAATHQPKIDLPTSTYGENTMNQRVLIAYASKAGSTAEIASRIGETLSGHNLQVDVMPIKKVADITPYQTVIVGSAIRIGQLLPEAMKFIQKYQTVLQQKTFGAFVVCMTLKDDTEANRKTVSAYLDPVRALVKPDAEGLFAGVIDPGKLNLLDRLIINAIKAPSGDFRRWNQIQVWAESMSPA
mgnify:CR=1 FL=1